MEGSDIDHRTGRLLKYTGPGGDVKIAKDAFRDCPAL